jgi:DNA-binding CsgD family transcriptional regulator
VSDETSLKAFSELAKAVLDEPTPDQFVAHIAMRILQPLDCRGAILGLVRNEGFLDLIGTHGYEKSATSPFARMPLWTPTPITDAVRTGEISIFNSPTEMVEKYPHLASVTQSEVGVTVSMPIKYRNTVIGAAGFTSLQAPENGFHVSPLTDGILALCGIYYSIHIKSLSDRQKQIIMLFREELTTDQMADRLKYSSSTIKQDIIKIYSIFGVNSRTAVLELAEKAGIIQLSKAL